MRLLEQLHDGLAALQAQGLRRQRRTTASACAPRLTLSGETQGPARQVLNFSSNDYLGLASHAAVTAALGEGAARYGAGSGGSHLILGHSEAHARLEERLAHWQAPYIPDADALYFCSGYMANLAVLTALGSAQATIFSEELNHASLIDGARLARASVQRFAHRDLSALDALLTASSASVKIIASDTVFSMDGSLADTPALLALAERHDAWLVLDDAHGFGVLGRQGRGALEEAGLCSPRIVYVGTLSKAAGVSGAFVAAHQTVVEHLIQRARPYIYTTAAPPAIAHALLTSLDIIGSAEGHALRQRLQAHIAELRDGIGAAIPAGCNARLANSSTAIQPLIVGDNARVMALARQLDDRNILVGAIRPPTVPAGTGRLRITLGATHDSDDLECLIAALRTALREAPAQEAA